VPHTVHRGAHTPGRHVFLDHLFRDEADAACPASRRLVEAVLGMSAGTSG
jgi:hypothetical protein